MTLPAIRLSLLALAVSASLHAQTATPNAHAAKEFPEVLVQEKAEKTRTVDDLEQAQLRLDERAGATSLIDGTSYRGGRVSTLTDALGYAPGVFIQPRFGAEEARLSIRGSGLQRTFHGRGLELLQDGSPLNLADGGFDFQAVEPLSARYIEVYRGANALEYGAASLGGAINFVTPSGYDAAAVSARTEFGSFGYQRAQITAAGHAGAADGYVSVSSFDQEGFRDHADSESYRLFGNAGYRFSDAVDGRLYVTHVDTRSALPGNLTLAESLLDPELAAPGNIALNQRRDFSLDRIASKLVWAPSDAQSLTWSAFHSDRSLDHPIFQVLRQQTADYGFDLRWRSSGTLAGLRNQLIAGITFVQGDVEDDRYVNVAGNAGARTNQYDQSARNGKLYIENQTWLDERWVVSVGAQALDATRRSRDEFITAGINESFDIDYSGISPKLGLRYLRDETTQIFANISRSLEPPSFGELSGGPGITQVDEQEATTAEIGVRMRNEVLSLDAALYRARIDGELLALVDNAGNPLGTRNADRTIHQGIELGLGWSLSEAWTLSSNYLYNDFKFSDDAVFGNNDLAGVPPQQLRTELRWSPSDRFYIAPNVEWAPNDYYIDHANTFEAPGYAITGIRIGGRVMTAWSWFADARNLSDRKWIASTNVLADARGLDGRNFLPGDGRSFYVGIEWRQQ